MSHRLVVVVLSLGLRWTSCSKEEERERERREETRREESGREEE
jgi:hypothetical protein